MNLARIRSASLFAAAATLSAVLSDWTIEESAERAIFGLGYVEHDRGAVPCMLVAGLVFLLAAALIGVAQKARARRSGPSDDDWLAETARDIARRWSWNALARSLLFALAVRYAMESARVMQADGHPATLVDWLGGPTLLALAIHATFCALTFFGLIFAMRSIDGALDSIARLVVAFFVTLARHLAPNARRLTDDAFAYRTYAALLARLCGDRAPPGAFASP